MDSFQTDKKKFVDDVAKVELQTLQISQEYGLICFIIFYKIRCFKKKRFKLSIDQVIPRNCSLSIFHSYCVEDAGEKLIFSSSTEASFNHAV